MDSNSNGGLQQQVLYVEDHPVNVILMEALFMHRPHLQLHVATSGEQAVRVAAALQPALVLLDLRLPDCHGEQLLPVLRRLRGWEDVPAVAVTAEDDFEITGTGFCELWPKPLDMLWVLQRLDELTHPTARPGPAGSPWPTLDRGGLRAPLQRQPLA